MLVQVKAKVQLVENSARKDVSFVIRLWLEPRDKSGKPEWRWQVHHVQTGVEAHFHRLGDVSEYIRNQSDTPPPA